MKNRPILISTLALTIFIEIILIVLVYNAIGAERLPMQLFRLSVQIALIGVIIDKKSSVALFILAAYHIFNSLLNWPSFHSGDSWRIIFFIYHILVGLVIYFHDSLEKLLRNAQNNPSSS